MNKTTASKRALYIPVGNGTPNGTAQMSFPTSEFLYNLRYGTDKSEAPLAKDRLVCAGLLESYEYLVMHCTKDEAWRRIKQMRAAIERCRKEG